MIDLSGQAGAFCARLLRDMGMEVAAAGEKGLVLDLETEGGRESLRNLVAGADVLIQSFRPGYLDECGLGYPELSALNPRLVMASITGFGQSGPYRDYLYTDIVAEAMGGQMSACGEAEGPPLCLPGEQSYRLASLFAAAGVLLALRARRTTGRGQHIDISLQECVAATLDHVLPRYFGAAEVAKRQGSLHWNGAFSVFPCRDGFILLSLLLQWETLVEWLDSEGMAEDLGEAEWQDAGRRRQGISHIVDVVGRWALTHGAGELEEQGQLMGFPWARVASLREVVEGPELNARGVFGVGPRRSQRELPLSLFSLAGGERHALASTGRLPLAGVRVLDFTRVLAGPYCTRILADFGAEVVKVQFPGAEEEDAFGRAYYRTWNRNKLSIALDLSRPGDMAVVRKLVAKCDLLVENFTPRVMQNWGLGWQEVHRINPRIIMVSLSALGRTGPRRNYSAFGPTVHALSGMTYLTALPGAPPVGPGHAYADHVAGTAAALAALGALERRGEMGEGEHLDVPEVEAVWAMLDGPLGEYLKSGVDRGPMGNRSTHAAPHGCYCCRGEDSWCVIAVEDDAQWKSFGEAVGDPGWTGDRRFASLGQRLANAGELDRLVESWTRLRAAQEVVSVLQKAGVPAGIVQDAAALAADPQLCARGFFMEDGGRPGFMCDANPIRMSGTPAQYRRPAPSPDQDRDWVMREIVCK